MKKLAFTTLLIGLFAMTTFAQKDQTLFGKSGLGLSGAWGASTTNLTFFEDDFTVITGGYGGLEFGKSLFVGWGGYETTNDFRLGTQQQNNDLSMSYNGLMLGYAPFSHKAIHPKFTVLAGGGNLRVRGEGSDDILVIEPAVGAEINVLSWFRVGLDAGYRFVTATDLLVNDSNASAPYGQVTFKFGYSWGRKKNRRNIRFDNYRGDRDDDDNDEDDNQNNNANDNQ